jgi:tetrahydromethanopterin S-methyltransferase subunit E
VSLVDPELRKKAVVAALGLAAFFAAGPVSRGLRRRFPEYPFASQVIVGGSLAVGVYCFAKALTPAGSKVPETMLAKSWGVFGGAYQSMKNDVGFDAER